VLRKEFELEDLSEHLEAMPKLEDGKLDHFEFEPTPE
jgi:hypothetical protein